MSHTGAFSAVDKHLNTTNIDVKANYRNQYIENHLISKKSKDINGLNGVYDKECDEMLNKCCNGLDTDYEIKQFIHTNERKCFRNKYIEHYISIESLSEDKSKQIINETIEEQKNSCHSVSLDHQNGVVWPNTQSTDSKEEDNSEDEEEVTSGDMITPLPRFRSKSLISSPQHIDRCSLQHKKVVRFADELGLDLVSIRCLTLDDLNTTVKQLTSCLLKPVTRVGQLSAQYNERCTDEHHLIQTVLNNNVCLERSIVWNSGQSLYIKFIIRVMNLSFEKSVTLRYTLNDWLTYDELVATYIPNSSDEFSDKFTATLILNIDNCYLYDGQKLMYAIRYMANGGQYWDNNGGKNYSHVLKL